MRLNWQHVQCMHCCLKRTYIKPLNQIRLSKSWGWCQYPLWHITFIFQHWCNIPWGCFAKRDIYTDNLNKWKSLSMCFTYANVMNGWKLQSRYVDLHARQHCTRQIGVATYPGSGPTTLVLTYFEHQRVTTVTTTTK